MKALKILKKLFSFIFPPIHGIGLTAEEDVRARSKWLGNDLGVWQGLAQKQPEPDLEAKIAPQVIAMDIHERASLIRPCTPAGPGQDKFCTDWYCVGPHPKA